MDLGPDHKWLFVTQICMDEPCPRPSVFKFLGDFHPILSGAVQAIKSRAKGIRSSATI